MSALVFCVERLHLIHRYWPDPTSTPSTTKQDYGDITVVHELSEPHKNYILRVFTIRHQGEERKVSPRRMLTYLSECPFPLSWNLLFLSVLEQTKQDMPISP